MNEKPSAQPVPGQRDVLVLHHVEQDLILLEGELHSLAGDRDRPRLRIEHELARGKQRGLLALVRRVAPREHRRDPRHQLLGAEGLDHVVVYAQLEAEELVVLLAPGGEHDDGDVLALADLLAGRIAVELGHHDVHDNEVVVVEHALVDGLHAVLGLVGLVIVELRVLAYDSSYHLFVVYYKDLCHRIHRL